MAITPQQAKPKAVFLDALSLGPIDLSPLEEHAELVCWPSTQPSACLQRLDGAAIAITNKIRLDADLLHQLPDLRLICAASTGTDQVDHGACQELGIEVRNAGRYSKASVVQVTWALILELACQLQTRRQQVRDGQWQRSPVFALVEPEFDELAGRHLSVIGAGDIGNGVAAIGEAFGMTVDRITSRSSAAQLEAAIAQRDLLVREVHHRIKNNLQGVAGLLQQIAAARAAFFPNITLTAAGGTASAQLDGLFRGGSQAWSFTPSLDLPIFDGGARKARVEVSEATRQEAIAGYELALQSAFREVADALAVRDRLAERLDAQQAQVAAAEQSLRLAEQSYRLGSISQLELLDAQRQLAAARQQLVTLRQTEQANRVELMRVLGGRWQG